MQKPNLNLMKARFAKTIKHSIMPEIKKKLGMKQGKSKYFMFESEYGKLHLLNPKEKKILDEIKKRVIENNADQKITHQKIEKLKQKFDQDNNVLLTNVKKLIKTAKTSAEKNLIEHNFHKENHKITDAYWHDFIPLDNHLAALRSNESNLKNHEFFQKLIERDNITRPEQRADRLKKIRLTKSKN